jgi:hypothetical protein
MFPWYRLPWALVVWVFFGIVKLILKYPIGYPAVLFSVVGDGAYRTPKMWRFFADAEYTPWKIDHLYPKWMPRWRRLRVWWYNAERNPVQGMADWFDLNVPFREFSSNYPGDIEESHGFHWRYRWAGWKDGLRVTWGNPRAEGKKEFWVGFQVGSVDPGFTFQLRFR